MEKILLAIDPLDFNQPAVDFATYMARLTRSKLTGVFLENIVAEEKPVLRKVYGSASLEWEVDEKSTEHLNRQQLIDQSIARFRQACELRETRCNVHRDRSVPADEMIAESRYADLLIVDAATSFNKQYDGLPTEFVSEILKEAECPIIIAPESFEQIDEVIFAYNNSKSSVFAIKQFTYLFPQLGEKKTTIVRVSKDGTWNDPDKHNFREWLQNHYSAIGFETLAGDSEDKLFDYIWKKKNILLVMGAYGRTAISRFFRHSHADLLIKMVPQPIFIAHY